VTSIPRLSFIHMGIYVTDLARRGDFYTRVLGFAVTERGVLGALTIVFLSLDPKEYHQIAFRLAELADLRTMALPGFQPVEERRAQIARRSK
jgi:catechol 2,3-dioxygenase